MNGTLNVAATLVPGVYKQALLFDGLQQWAEIGVNRGDCFVNLMNCPTGATYAAWMWIGPKSAANTKMYFLASGGAPNENHGISMYKEGNTVKVSSTQIVHQEKSDRMSASSENSLSRRPFST